MRGLTMGRGHFPITEREKEISKIIQALEKHPEGLGVRELRKESGIGSFSTIYKYLRQLLEEKKVVFHTESVGRGKPKKIYKLTKKGIAHILEFRTIEQFEKIRESCKKNEQFELDNYAFSYVIYGLPKNLRPEEKKQVNLILKEVNRNLLELDELINQIVNREANKYRKKITKVYEKILQCIPIQNKEKKPRTIDKELLEEIHKYIPLAVKEKMRLKENKFALVVTRGPSFIDEFSLRPENHLLWLIQSVENWNEDKINFIIKQLARNKLVDQEAIARIKKWNIPNGITRYYWQRIIDQLDDIPKIREKMNIEKEYLMQSDIIKQVIGIKNSLIITKDMLGKEKLEEIKKELLNLK